jgi:hypothetical protein
MKAAGSLMARVRMKVSALPESCVSNEQFDEFDQGSCSTLLEFADSGEDAAHEKAARIV